MIENHIYPAIAFVVSLLITVVAMPRLLRFCLRRGLYDIPNERKVHKNRTPRLGGALFIPAMMCGIIVTLLVMQGNGVEGLNFKLSTMVILLGILLIYFIGLLDDILGLRASFKFVVQLIASLFMPLCGLYINNLYGLMGIHEIPIWVGYPLTIFLSLLIVNAINLIDGIDGLASGLSVIALSSYYILFSQVDVLSYLIFIAALIGTLSVFMYFNLAGSNERGTKTFMGDTGSLILGYAIAFLAIKYAMANERVLPVRSEPLLTAMTPIIVPIFDLVRVAFGRIRRHISIFHADKTHLHHLCMAAGCSMHGALAVILILQGAFIGLNYILYLCNTDVMWVFLVDIAVFSITCLALQRVKQHHLPNP